MEIISRAQARQRGMRRYFTGKPCENGHIAERQVSNWTCLECHNHRKIVSYFSNHDEIKQRRRERHSERMNASEYKEARRLASQKYKQLNPDQNAAHQSAWAKRNRASLRAVRADYRAKKHKATPSWANKDSIREIYKAASELGFDVDHIVPLRSKIVCGLHCEANLQILPPLDNKSKGNRYWPDMP